MDDLIVLSRFVHFAALSLLLGGSLFRLGVRRQRPDETQQWARAIDIAAAVAALLSALGWFVGVAATMAGDWAQVLAPDTVAAVFIDTQFGRVWIGRLALAAAILGLVLASRARTQRLEVAILLLSAGLTASLAGIGHGSVGAGMVGLVHVAADVVHLLCAAAWLGGLFGVGLILRRAGREYGTSFDLVRTAVQRFSRLGHVAVALLLVTGVLNTIVLVAQPESLITTAYGRVLLLKIGLFAVMLAIAVRNAFVFARPMADAWPSDRADGDSAALYRGVAVEQGVGLLVLATVAALGLMHPFP